MSRHTRQAHPIAESIFVSIRDGVAVRCQAEPGLALTARPARPRLDIRILAAADGARQMYAIVRAQRSASHRVSGRIYGL